MEYKILLTMAHGEKNLRPSCAPVPKHREAALLWGLGRETSREQPGQEASLIRCPYPGQPLRTNSSSRFRIFFAAPLSLSTDSRGQELPFSQLGSFGCLHFAAKFFRYPQGEFLSLFNFFFRCGSSLDLVYVYMFMTNRLYLSCLLSRIRFLYILRFQFCGYFES